MPESVTYVPGMNLLPMCPKAQTSVDVQRCQARQVKPHIRTGIELATCITSPSSALQALSADEMDRPTPALSAEESDRLVRDYS